jgi:hypothetical protein
MTLSKTASPFLLAIALTWLMPAPVMTQTCAQLLDNLQARMNTVNAEARANGMNFLRSDVEATLVGAAKRRLEAAGDPTVEAINQVQEARDKVEAWAARMNSFKDFFDRLRSCLTSGCNMLKFLDDEMRRINLVESVRAQLNDWVQSLGDAGISAATERVNKASSLISNTIGGAQGLAESSITGAAQCMGRYVRDAQTSSANPADPTAVSTPPPPTGSGMGKMIGVMLAGGAALIGGAYVWQQAEELAIVDPIGGPVNPPPVTTTGGGGASANYRYANWNCGSSSQCATVFGASTGSAGPFCTAAGCTDWGRTYGGGVTCTAQPQDVVRTRPNPGVACF